MIIEFLAQHPVLIAGIVSVFIFWYTFIMFRRTLNENTESTYTKTWDDYKREARNTRIELGTQTEEDIAEIRQQMDYAYSHSSGSVRFVNGYQYGVLLPPSGTVDGLAEWNAMNEDREVVRCKYCKRQNKATNEVCLGCGATL